jgi:flagellar hook-associated protein 3 FlgL
MNFGMTSHSALLQSQVRSHLKARMEAIQSEVSSGIIQNPGRTLGANSRNLISAFQDRDLVAAYRVNIQRANSHLDATYNSLGSLNDLVENLKQSLVAVQATTGDTSSAFSSARSLLSGLPAIFGNGIDTALSGQNGAATKIIDYFSPASPQARENFLSRFAQQFGERPANIDASRVTAVQISAFFESVEIDYQNETGWSNIWTGGPIDATTVPIGKGDAIALPSLTNVSSLRALTAAAITLVELGMTNLNPDTRDALVQKTLMTVSVAQKTLTGFRAVIGEMQNRISVADARQIENDASLVETIGEIQGVDQNAAISELMNLKSQLEVSYTVTSYLNDMLLVKYLR